MVSIRPHFPTVKHTPAKESKVHNGGAPYLRPDLRISWSLHVWGSPVRTWDSRSITVRALTFTLILFPQLFWAPSSPETALSASQILPTKDLRDLLICIMQFIYKKNQCLIYVVYKIFFPMRNYRS